MKLCSKCQIEKSEEEFSFQDKSVGKRMAWCKKCCSERGKTLYRFECVDCGKPCERTKSRVSTTNRCLACARAKIIRDNGGVPVNYSGTYNFAGKTFATWVASAKKRKIDWELTKEQVEDIFSRQNGRCALSGIEMMPKKNTPYRPSLDRIDSAKGYVLSNVQFVCSVVNVMKNKFVEEEFIKICKLIAEHRGKVT